MKALKDNLGLVALIVTLGGGLIGWLGLKDVIANTRPVWLSDLIEAKQKIEARIDDVSHEVEEARSDAESALQAHLDEEARSELWNARSLLRLTDEALQAIGAEELAGGVTPSTVERKTKLGQQREWIERRVQRAEAALEEIRARKP